jgi:DHA3 family macrolide efflux protein-like MFS transporter
MIHALKQRMIVQLWMGQALSTIGDEIYRVGLTWIAVGLVGADAGYLGAGQAAALMTMSLVGGHWADRWSPVATMMRTDIARAAFVMVPVIWSYFAPLNLGVLWFVSLSVASLSAFFEPAMHSLLPVLAKDRKTLKAANGLMGTTFRLARMVGPTTVGLLAAWIPMIQFFSIDAVTFLISALNIGSIHQQNPDVRSRTQVRASFSQSVRSGFQLLNRHANVSPYYYVKLLTSGSWTFVIGLGLALFVKDLSTSGSVSDFGLTIASYGIGNFIGALFFGNYQHGSPKLKVVGGYIVLGSAFICASFCTSMTGVMSWLALAGFAGPVNDLGFLEITQQTFRGLELQRIARVRIVIETASALAFLLLAPLLLKLVAVKWMIGFSGALWLLAAAYIQSRTADTTDGSEPLS